MITQDDPPGENVTRLPVRFQPLPDDARSRLGPNDPPYHPTCGHRFVQYWVDPAAAEVICGRCKTKLNPMWVLGVIAAEDRRYAESQKAAKAAQERLAERSRTKCEHCDKMTRISRR